MWSVIGQLSKQRCRIIIFQIKYEWPYANCAIFDVPSHRSSLLEIHRFILLVYDSWLSVFL